MAIATRSINDNVRFLMGTGSAIEKQTPYFAGQILTAAANLSTSPSYGEVLALKFNHQLEEDDINALGIILPPLAKLDAAGTQLEHGRLEARAAQVCLKIFNLWRIQYLSLKTLIGLIPNLGLCCRWYCRNCQQKYCHDSYAPTEYDFPTKSWRSRSIIGRK